MKISEAFVLYHQDYMVIKSNSQRMVETHSHAARTLCETIGDKDIENFTIEDLGRWAKKISKGRCQNTVRNDLTRLRQVLKYLNLRGIEVLNPALVPIPKRIDTTPEFLSAEEVEAMINCAYSLRNKFIISLLYASGIRLSEMLSLDRGQIRERKFSVVGKGGKARLCFIDERTEELMSEYLRSRNDHSRALIVTNLHKERMTPTNVQLVIKNSAERAGIDRHITPHTLRHSFATNFLKNGGDIRYLQILLGHASVATTMRYTHVVDCDLEEKYRKYHGK